MANSIKDNRKALLRFVEEEYGLKNPQIIIPKVKIGACLEVDDVLMIVTGTNGTQLVGKNAIQLVLDKQYEKYFKRVLQYLEKIKEKQKVSLKSYREINVENNTNTFDMLVKKIKSKPYLKRPAISNIVSLVQKEKFVALSLEEQCFVLSELLNLLSKSLTANLTLMGGSKGMGDFKISKKMSGCKNVLLHNYSITGLFEQKPVDMLKIWVGE